MREEIYTKKKKMIKNWISEEILQHQDFPLTLRNMERIKDLRILLESTQSRLSKLEKDGKEDLITQERIILEGTRKEIRRLEREALHSELGA